MMDINQQKRVLKALSKGLPICEEPYKALAESLNIKEQQLLNFIQELKDSNVISRLGMIINPESVGYHCNALVVWDVPDDEVDEVGTLLGLQEKISLCYKRPRQMPDWPYNLFTMLHGKNQQSIISELNHIVVDNDIGQYACDILFSTKTFKHSGARTFG